MVCFVRENLAAAVELLEQHDARELVGEGHGREGKALVRPRKQRGGQAVGAAQHEYQAPRAARLYARQAFRQRGEDRERASTHSATT